MRRVIHHDHHRHGSVVITEDGTYEVPSDATLGAYTATGGTGCYWARLSGFSGELSDIIVNDYVTGWATVQVSPNDAGFASSRCGTWERVEVR